MAQGPETFGKPYSLERPPTIDIGISKVLKSSAVNKPNVLQPKILQNYLTSEFSAPTFYAM